VIPSLFRFEASQPTRKVIMNTWLKNSEINVSGYSISAHQAIACACLCAAQAAFMVVLFNVYCGVTGI
jgi:hypothetical protein